MIYGIGTDITAVKRFEKWIERPEMISRFFNQNEIMDGGTLAAKREHYGARFAAKEAFSKALGTGIVFDLKDVFVVKDENGKPDLTLQNSALAVFTERCGNLEDFTLHVSLSHEKEFATAVVIIEKVK